MPNRHLHRGVPSSAGYGGNRSHKEPELQSKTHGSRSVKKLVRSLSDRYSAVTSPLTCKKKTSCSSRTPSLKTMKTTAATSLLPLKPALSVSCRPTMQSASRKDSLSSPAIACLAQSTPSIAMSRRLVHMQPLACTETPVSLPRSHVLKRPQLKEVEPKKSSMRTPSTAEDSSLQVVNVTGREETSPLAKTEMRLVSQSSASSHKQTRHALEVLSSDYKNWTKLEWQKLEALLQHKDEEVESLQTAGLMLKELCMKQDDEIKTLKAAFPATLREMAQLREACQKQEKELANSRVMLPALQAQVTSLMEQLRAMTEDLTQMKALKEASPEKVSSHFHEREASNSSSSCLSIEPSPVTTNGFLEHLRHSRKGQSMVRLCEATSSCSSVASIEPPSSETLGNGRHRREFSAVLSVEHMLKGSGKRSGRRLLTDTDIVATLQELDNAAEREQALLQERCANAVKELRSSSSRFTSLEPIKSILTCASPQLCEGSLSENEKQERKPLPRAELWNLKPT